MALLDISAPRSASLRPFNLFAFAARTAALYRQRAALRRLDADALRDIGISRAEATAEAQRPVWDVPHNWHN
ncbi:DUF1127 domain-containing protein [Aliishimia ponticola]|uniref:DUF1127 domain-containing protein n=1 Tax=Aliishimia ponticola TaxID=2499833 RepID=A0A4S4NAY3_9RHOB|nr:DUF1127 domain-containing protein [Aliishimia ponticola]THH35835.1 DUF1127 domain-containing protein [Aliishimia ponticola]